MVKGINKKDVFKASNALNRASELDNDLQVGSLIKENTTELIKDEYQDKAVKMVLENKYSSIIGAAGTGKTQVLINIIQEILHTENLKPIYFNKKEILPIAFVSFTNKAVNVLQQRLSTIGMENNCFTIHNMVDYRPVMTPKKWDNEGNIQKLGKEFFPMKGVQKITSVMEDVDINGHINLIENNIEINEKLPFKYIFIDEMGNIGENLWHNLVSAVTKECKIIMLGDLAQLPPVIGISPLTYNLAINPSVELINIYRNAEDNDIPLVAKDIREGIVPNFKKYKDVVHFDTTTIEHKFTTGNRISQDDAIRMCGALISDAYRKELYNPLEDAILTGTNHVKNGINKIILELSNPPVYNKRQQQLNQRYILNTKGNMSTVCIGAKVVIDSEDMVKVAITNSKGDALTKGTLGIIKKIRPNKKYAWTYQEYQAENLKAIEIENSLSENDTDGEAVRDYDLEEIIEQQKNELEQAKQDEDYIAQEEIEKSISKYEEIYEEIKTRQLNYELEIEFEEGTTTVISTIGQLNSINLGYCLTPNKAQGSQFRAIFWLGTDAPQMRITQTNEALYTSVTRGIKKSYLICTKRVLERTIAMRRIYGNNGYEKSAYMLKNANNATLKVLTENEGNNMPHLLFDSIKNFVDNHSVYYDDVCNINLNWRN